MTNTTAELFARDKIRRRAAAIETITDKVAEVEPNWSSVSSAIGRELDTDRHTTEEGYAGWSLDMLEGLARALDPEFV